MKYAFAFAGLVAGALAGECYAPAPPAYSAAPAPSATPAPGPGYFAVISSRSASPIHLQSVTARGGKFYIGAGPPSSYCPENIGSGCPAGNDTIFSGGDGQLSLGVVVPGGQQVYVAKDGALSYTVPHSAAIPDGSVVDQFSKTAPGSNNLGTLNFETGFVACPVGGAGAGYQVYGQVDGFEASSECLGFSALTCKFSPAHLPVLLLMFE
ncbi:hypothetical protein N0V95_009704 [Ascochyta clinopodiicola]|nr:hypothetical protein N0V95_009704 [Ascochyta clinopodiicola]